MSSEEHLEDFIEMVKDGMEGGKPVLVDFIDSTLDMYDKYKYVNEINTKAMKEEEWTPKEGDLIEVSDDGVNWSDEGRIFLAVIPRVESPVAVVYHWDETDYDDEEEKLSHTCFRYMRPIKEDLTEDLTEAEAFDQIKEILSRIKK